MILKDIHISDVLKLSAAFVIAILALEIVFAINPVLLIFFTAIILAIAMERPINSLEARGISRMLSSIMLYASFFVGLIALLSVMLPPIATEFRSFVVSYPAYSEALLGDEESLELNVMPNMLILSESVAGSSQAIVSTVFKTFGGVTSFLAVFFIAFFLNAQPGGIRSFIYPFVPKQYKETAVSFLDRVQDRVGNWLWGKVLSSVLVGIFTLTGLLLFGVPYAFILAVLAIFLNFIPFIGPIIASIPAILLALTQSPLIALGVGLYYFFVNGILEAFVFGPIFMKRAIQVNSALLILFVISGAYLGGVFGIIIAIPTAAIIYLAVSEYHTWKTTQSNEERNL